MDPSHSLCYASVSPPSCEFLAYLLSQAAPAGTQFRA